MTPQLYALKAQARTFILRHHPTLFLVTILLLLVGAAYSLYLVIYETPEATTPPDTLTSFNQKTIDQIKSLRSSTDGVDKLTFPTPRSNPFVEK